MRLIQKKIDELNSLDVPLSRKDDFESFWDEAVEKVNNHEFSLKTTELTDYPLDNIVIYDSIFHGLDGTPIKCWIILPENARQKPVPAISCFHGGNGNRGFPFSHLYWVNAGFAVIAMDFRQQGGQTGSNTSFKTCGQKNFITMNIEDYKSYYLYHAWTDALLSVKAIQSIPEVDEKRVSVCGASQGGGTSMVVSALNHNVSLCMAAVPSYCWWERRIEIRSASAGALSKYIEMNPDSLETVYNTMSYYDVVNFADKIKCPTMVSCGFNDGATPPDCVYSAYNKIQSEKYMNNYPAGEHTMEPKEILNWLNFARER